jgi:hypothetical protein
MSDIQVIKYKDDNTVTPFYLKKYFLLLLFVVLGFIIIAFFGFLISSIFNFVSYYYTTLYNSTKSYLSILNQNLVEIDINIKEAHFNRFSQNLNAVGIANNTIFQTLIPEIRKNFYIFRSLESTFNLYQNKTIIDFQILEQMNKGNYNLSHIIYSNNYMYTSDTIINSVEQVIKELSISLVSIDNANLSFSIISFLLSILLTPLLLIAIIFLLVSQLVYIRKIKGLNTTKFKKINELLLLDTFNNSQMYLDFIEFCKIENSQAYVYFWKDLQNFKNITFQKDEELKRKFGFDIYEKYIKKDSEMEILISVDDRETIFNNLNHPFLNLFDKIENDIEDVLLNSHQKFKRKSL